MVPAGAFFPKPKIDSEVLEIEFFSSAEPMAANERYLFDVIKAAFGRRRKNLKNSLAGRELNITKAIAGQALSDAGIDPSRRAETLSVAEFVALSNSLGRMLGPQH